MKQKYYAVRKGKKTGIFRTWTETKQSIDGFSGAEYKSFKTLADAEDYLTAHHQKAHVSDSALIAYVDGSKIPGKRGYGSGVVILDGHGTVLQKQSFFGDDPRYNESRQIMGEIAATLAVLTYAVDNDYSEIVIYHDYVGIQAWADGEWQAKKPVSQDYVSRFNELVARHSMTVVFEKVAAHTDDQYNDIADQLAKEAIRQHSAQKVIITETTPQPVTHTQSRPRKAPPVKPITTNADWLQSLRVPKVRKHD